jgi:predicted permease
MFDDLRYGLRALLRTKGWTAVVVLTLALGIGANAALFSGVNALLLKELPVSDPESLVRLRYAFARSNDMFAGTEDYGLIEAPVGQNIRASFSYRLFRELRAANRSLEDLFACAPLRGINVVVDGAADIATGFISSGNYYEVLGVRAQLGRTIAAHDDRPGAPPVAVISDKYWRSRFSADPQVVGKVVTARNVPVTIVGVLQPEFTGVQRSTDAPPDIAFPLALDVQLTPATGAGRQRLDHPAAGWLQLMGRLRPGGTAKQAQANLATVFQVQAQAGMNDYLASLPEAERSSTRNRNRTQVPRLLIDSGARGIYHAGSGDVQTIRILAVVVGLVLLIVCANVANLLLSRAASRQKEISIRLSAGATRGRLIRQLLTESVLLAFIGGALGILVAYWSTHLLPGTLGEAASLDWYVLGFTLAVTTITGLAFGMAPALRATRINISTTLKANSRGIVASRTLLSKSLVIAQVALSVILLVGAGLLLRTLQNLRNVDVGFNTENLVVFDVAPGLIHYEPSRYAALYEELTTRVRAVPGVSGVTFSHLGLLSGGSSATTAFALGRETDGISINRLGIAPNFLETMGISLLVGRSFGSGDGQTTPKVAIINQTAARRIFPNGNPIGLRFGDSVERSGDIEVIGVVRDAKYSSVRDDAPPTIYVPFAQMAPTSAVFEVRTAGDPVELMGTIRETVRQILPNLPLTNVSTQAARIEGRFAQERLLAQAYAAFAALALTIASIGLFGVMSYSVTRRTKEIGIRLAVGAPRNDVLWLVMRDSLMLVAIGVVLGIAGVIGARDLVSSVLYGVTATDSLAVAMAIGMMVGVSTVAGYLPARRASRVNPLDALRYE